MCNLPSFYTQFPPANYIISDSYPYSGKIMVLAHKILWSSWLLIRSVLMQKELLGSLYPKERFPGHYMRVKLFTQSKKGSMFYPVTIFHEVSIGFIRND